MATSTNKNNTQKKGLSSLFTGIANEIKRIRWPKFSELMESTGKVLVFCVLFALFFVVCDLLVSELLILLGVGK